MNNNYPYNLFIKLFSFVFLFCVAQNSKAQFNPSPWTITTTGNTVVTVPAGVTSIDVECWGGGGGGGSGQACDNSGTFSSAGGGGGGGGAYVKVTSIAVSPGQNITFTVGTGGNAGSNGGNGSNGIASSVTYNAIVVAKGIGGGKGNGASGSDGTASGTAGSGGQIANNIPASTGFAGGNGAAGNAAGKGGGGGGGAGSGGNGGNAAGQTGGTGTATGGGNGGTGPGFSGIGAAGSVYGGGGSGSAAIDASNDGTCDNKNGGAGAQGKIIVTYTQILSTLTLGNNAPGAANQCRSTTKVQLQGFSLAVTGGTGDLTDVGFTTTGTYVQADISKYQLWYNSANNLGTASQLGVDLASAGGAGARSFASFATPTLTNGSTYYFWITADIAAGATHNNTIACNGIATGNLTGNSTMAGGPTTAGGTQTLQAPTVNVGGAMAAICQSGTSAGLGGSVGGTATGGTWSDGGAGGTFNPNATTLNATYTAGAASGSPVTLTLTTSGGACGTTSANKQIVVNPNPTVNVGGAMAAICQSATSAALGGSVGGGATGGTWSDGGAGGTFNPNATTLNATYTAASGSGTPVTLTLTTSGGSCGTVNANKQIVVNPSPIVAAIGGGAASVCSGGTTPAFTDATGGGTWSITNGTGSANISVGGVVTGVSAGSVTVNYAVTASGCTTTKTAALTITAGPTITIQPTNQSLCASTNAIFTVATSAGGPSYQWQESSDNSSWSNVVNGTPAGYTYAGGTSASLTVSGAGSVVYYYRCIITAAGCSSASNSATALAPSGGAYTVSWPMTSGNLNPTVTGNISASAVSCAGASNFGYYNDCAVQGYAADTWIADTHCSSTTFLWGGGAESDYFQVSLSPITCATVNVTSITAQVNDGFSSCSPHQNFGKIGYSIDGGTTFLGIHTPAGGSCCYCFTTNGDGTWASIVTSSINLKGIDPVDPPVIASIAYPNSVIFRIYMDQNNAGNNSIRNYIKGIGIGGTVVTPLPINIISFTGENTHDGVLLNWQTSTELNNDYFSIEKSADGKEWTEIGKVKGAGNSSTARNYEFVDAELPSPVGEGPGLRYYRLKQTDFNGQFEYFGPISVKLAPPNEWSLIIKNPADDKLKGTLITTEDAQVVVDIIDLQGRTVRSEILNAVRGSNLLQINLDGITQGAYFIIIHNSQNKIHSKFVKIN